MPPKSELEMLRNAMTKVAAASGPRAQVDRLTQLRRLLDGSSVAQLGDGVVNALGALQLFAQRLDREVGEIRERLEEALQQKTGLDEANYVAFENHFRGAEAEIQKRLELYAPLLRELRGRYPDAQVYELGGGRGEMAEVVRGCGLGYSCVDINPAMVERLRARGFEAMVGDGIQALERRAPQSLGAIIAIHVIEHVPFRRVTELFRLAARCLRPGGLLILETPNAASLTAMLSFPIDPTHLRPVHPMVIQFLADRSGFDIARAEAMHGPAPLERVPADVPGADVLNRNIARLEGTLFAGHDFSFVARRRNS